MFLLCGSRNAVGTKTLLLLAELVALLCLGEFSAPSPVLLLEIPHVSPSPESFG